MGPSPILSVIHVITFGTMLNFNGGNNEHGLKYVTCKQTFFNINILDVSTTSVQLELGVPEIMLISDIMLASFFSNSAAALRALTLG